MATPIQGFPAKSLKASATVGSSLFDVITVGFSDKIAVNVNVNGKISSMYNVALNGNELSYLKTDSPSLDPLPFLDACALYGENDISRFYAIQIASTIVKECPEENRDAVIAIGPVGPSPGQPISKENREQLLEVVRLVQQCRVW